MTYLWNISQTDYLVVDGYITTAHWQATATEDTYEASVYGTCEWQPAIPAIQYADVTMQDVLDWCWASGVDQSEVEASLASSIALQQHPVSTSGVPW